MCQKERVGKRETKHYTEDLISTCHTIYPHPSLIAIMSDPLSPLLPELQYGENRNLVGSTVASGFETPQQSPIRQRNFPKTIHRGEHQGTMPREKTRSLSQGSMATSNKRMSEDKWARSDVISLVACCLALIFGIGAGCTAVKQHNVAVEANQISTYQACQDQVSMISILGTILQSFS